YIVDTIELIRRELPADIPLIGFAGAPFTLASYAIEGRGSRNYVFVKQMMYTDGGAWNALMDKLVETIADYARLQIRSGVQALQLFDSWIGCLSRQDFRRYVLPHSKRLIEAIRGEVPIIYFGTGNAHLVDDMYACGPDVMALDWRTPLRETWERLGCRAVQGNMDPIALCADRATVARCASEVLDEAGARPGHIFNLGHGIIPETPVENVKFLVEYVHEASAR
ncbi:MAG: uroporphyrinogen decarboxylase family protein, partial [Gammaproteobacteria bacterium]